MAPKRAPTSPTSSHPIAFAENGATLGSSFHGAEATTTSIPTREPSRRREEATHDMTFPLTSPSLPPPAAFTEVTTNTAARSPRNSSTNNRENLRRSAAVLAASRNARYRQNWSQVVLGATSGIMFVLVVCLSYAMYILVTPYYYSITSGVLLSIVMHPQSRLRSVLYMGTAVERMRQVQQQWAVRGRLAGVIGSWLSLRHFASFVVMQMTFFLGLNKIRVAANSLLLGDENNTTDLVRVGSTQGTTSTRGTSATTMPKTPAETESAGESRATSPQPHPLRCAAHMAQWKAATGALHASSSSDSSAAASSAWVSRSQTLSSPVEGQQQKPAPTNASIALESATATLPTTRIVHGHRRLVATARGRRVLRYLTIATLVVLAHLLVGTVYFILLHLALVVVFALVVPLMSASTFVTSMGRLWRIALALFFMVGLALNLTSDVLSISHVVRQTTSAVVRSGSNSGGGGDLTGMEPQSLHNLTEHDIAAVRLQNSADASAATVAFINGTAMRKERGWKNEEENNVDAFELLREHRGKLASLVVHPVQIFVVQELAGVFSNGNVSEMLSMLTRVLPPQLQSIMQQDTAENEDEGGLAHMRTKSRNKGSSWYSIFGQVPPTAMVSSSSPSSSTKNSTALAFAWANIRALGSVNSLKSLAYASLSTASAVNGTSCATSNNSDGKKACTALNDSTTRAGGGSEVMQIDWVMVFRLLAFRLLPYAEYVLRLLIRLASNMMELFDTIYALMLFVFFYRYLTQLEHTVLYYGVVKLLRVIQPDVGDLHARTIEHDITVSFITLLQSFWHLTWFHFCVTFCAFKMWGFPTPFLLGLVSVFLALFPLVPKWLSPCSIAFVYMVVQLISLTTSERIEGSPFLLFPDGHGWTEALILGKPYLLSYVRTFSFGVSVLLECGDEWLLCVSRGLRGGFGTDAVHKGREQLQPFVVGTALVLGFVAYGIRGIVFGPLTVIVARVLFDNWDVVLSDREMDEPPSPPPSLLAEDEEGEEDESNELQKRGVVASARHTLR